MADHRPVIIAVREVNLQYRNAPMIRYLRIKLDKVFLARQHLATRNPDAGLGHIAALHFLFPFRAIAWKASGKQRIFALSSGGVHYVAADKIFSRGRFVDIHQVRNRDPGGFSVVEPARAAFQLRQKACHAAAADLVDHVLSQRSTRVRETVFCGQQ